jgi:flagellar biosynthesis protein FlhG
MQTPASGQISGRVITVASGKGGVGKSNLCINFALGLQNIGYHPIVLDADIGFANVEVLLGARPKRTILDILDGADVWDTVQESASGLPFLSAGSGLLDIHSLTPRQMARLLEGVSRLHERYDVILVDGGAGIGENMERLIRAADQLLLVTTPEPTAIADGYSLLKLLAARGDCPPVQLVVNRVQTVLDGRVASEKLRLVAGRFLNMDVGVLGYVLDDDSVGRAVMRQTPLLLDAPNSTAARCFVQLVHNFVRAEVKPPKVGIAGFFERLFKRSRGRAGDPADPAVFPAHPVG